MPESEPPAVKSKGQTYEGLAFTFCKAALLMLLLQRFSLPVTSALCSVLYFLAAYHGQKETRCWARYPLLIATFWALVAIASWTALLAPPVWGGFKEHLRI